MIDLLGTGLVGVSSIILAFYIGRDVFRKKVPLSKKILILLFIISFSASIMRLNYLLNGIAYLNNIWSLLGFTYSLGICMISVSILFPKVEKTLFLIFMAYSCILISSLVFDLSFLKSLTPIFSTSLIALFVYLYIKFKSKKILYYIISMSIFFTGGLLSRVYYPIIYLMDTIAFIVIYLALK